MPDSHKVASRLKMPKQHANANSKLERTTSVQDAPDILLTQQAHQVHMGQAGIPCADSAAIRPSQEVSLEPHL